MSDLLDNDRPINFRDPQYRKLLRRLQGNIVKGHGRDYTVNIFLQFKVDGGKLRRVLRWLTRTYVTSAYEQLLQREQFKQFGIPGALFGNIFLTPGAYTKLGFADLIPTWFADPEDAGPGQGRALFANRMVGARREYSDTLSAETPRTPLEQAYEEKNIDAMLLLADDSEMYLLRQARSVMTRLERDGLADVLAVELGEVQRNEEQEGIEHFGYVDGRSQPLFLASDFANLEKDGSLGAQTAEKIEDKAIARDSGRINVWDPFARLKLALVPDRGAGDPEAFGSYYVFRKLEQDVDGFKNAEERLADALGLVDHDRQRAGAMIVGRFRDGTPLALSEKDGFIPAQANNFRYDGLDAKSEMDPELPSDTYALKCPFQAHIRKVNPRQNVNLGIDTNKTIQQLVEIDRDRRIVRRGMPYGKLKKPSAMLTQARQALPSPEVGLLFACFQASLRRQFGHMQAMWANNIIFMVTGTAENQTGLDGIIGQRPRGWPIVPQHWRATYGGETKYTGPIVGSQCGVTHPTNLQINGFVKFRGGEFFFAPSLPFLLDW